VAHLVVAKLTPDPSAPYSLIQVLTLKLNPGSRRCRRRYVLAMQRRAESERGEKRACRDHGATA
jgi:hypothetical protein